MTCSPALTERRILQGAAARMLARGRAASWPARLSPMGAAARVPLSNPPRLDDYLGFRRPLSLHFAPEAGRQRPTARERSGSVWPSRPESAARAAPRARLEPVQEVLTKAPGHCPGARQHLGIVDVIGRHRWTSSDPSRMYRLTRAVTSSAMPASRRGTESSAPVTGHPAAVRWGAFAASAVIADQVAIAFPTAAGCRLVGHARPAVTQQRAYAVPSRGRTLM
jgi:hypothetical protein